MRFFKKLLHLVWVVLAVSALTFVMVNILPGDVAHVIAGQQATAQEIAAIHKELGLDRPLATRYFIWLKNLAKGDLGVSFLTREPVLDTIMARLPVTLELLLFSQCLALLLALPTGIIAAYRKETTADRLISGVGFATLSTPSFVVALGAIYLFALRLKWLPAIGYIPFTQNPLANIRSFILPAASIALIEWVVLMQVLRSDMITTLEQNFILMAKAKGLSPAKVLLSHALRPSSFTLITVFGIQVGRHLSETIIIETIFALPGVGRLLITAIYDRDYQVVQGCVILITLGYVIINTVVDLLYTVLDPRIRQERSHG